MWVGFGWGAAVNYALTTVIFSLPLLLHATAEEVGATLLPMTLLVALNPLATGRLVAAYGPLRPIRMGFVAFPIGLGFVAVATAGHDRPFVLGFGLLLCGPRGLLGLCPRWSGSPSDTPLRKPPVPSAASSTPPVRSVPPSPPRSRAPP